MNELKVLSPLEVNYQEVAARVEEAVKGYRNIIVHEDNLPEIAKGKAAINKVLKEINDERIKIDKEWRKPLDELKKNYDAIINKGKEVVSQLDEELSVFEEKRRLQIFNEIESIFDSYNIKHFSLIDLFDPKWYNKTVDHITESKNKFERIQKDTEYIKTQSAELQTLALQNYKQTQDITQALSYAQKVVDDINARKEVERAAQAIESTPELKIEPIKKDAESITPMILIKSIEQFEQVIEFMEENRISFMLV